MNSNGVCGARQRRRYVDARSGLIRVNPGKKVENGPGAMGGGRWDDGAVPLALFHDVGKQVRAGSWGFWRKPLILSVFVGFCRFLSVKKEGMYERCN